MRNACFIVAVLWLWAAPLPAQTRPAAEGGAAATQPAGGAVLPHIRIDREHRLVDLEAAVVLRQADWLELLACSPRSREHEAILTIPARPSQIHLALVMIGLEPGAPMKWWREGDIVKSSAARGPRVAVSIVMDQHGREVEIPANQWIVNQKTGKPLEGDAWLFTGSEVRDLDGQGVYLADLNGTVLSLVNFGDDLLSRDTEMTNNNDDETWGINTKLVPPVGTAVIVRLRPVDGGPKSGKAEKPEAQKP